MTAPQPDAVAEIYGGTRDQLIGQLRSLSAEEAAALVPTCPQWTVKDVVAHVTGLVADIIAEVPPPLGSDEMTARQVGERSAMSLAAICDEWAGNAEAIVPFLVGVPLRGLGLTADLAVHVHDLAGTTGAVDPPPPEATAVACLRYVPLLQERVAEQIDTALTVTLDGQVTKPTAGAIPLGMQGTAEDFLLSVTGRRTRTAVADAFVWDGDPTPMLDRALLQYGPYRAD